MIRKMFSCACLPILFRVIAEKHYKITVSQGDICKHALSMLNVSGLFSITSGVSLLMNGKRSQIPVTPPERELQ